MRLTLRTLLAYLDDRLAPTNAREIGQKIANSPFATELVERIKEVKRRRRLASADASRPMVDANLVAEYLDDQLTPELVARVEQQVLSSDAMLAEVASAHEILGMLRDPVPLDARLRDRLYALDPNGPAEGSVPAESAGALKSGGIVAATWKPMDSYSPSRKWPAVVAGALGFIWLIALATDSNLFQGQETASTDPDAQDKTPSGELLADKDAGMPPKEADPDQPGEPKAGGKAEETVAAVVPDKTAPAETTVPSPDNDATTGPLEGGSSNASDKSDPTVAEGDKAASNAANPGDAEMEGPDADKPPVVAEEPPRAAEKMPVYLQVDSRTLFVSNTRENRWRNLLQIPGGDTVIVTPNSVNCGPFLKDDWFAIAESFDVRVRGQNSGWTCRVLGPSVVRLAQPDHRGLQLLSGRLILTADPQAAWDDQRKPEFSLQTGLHSTTITLDSVTTRIAVEATVRSSAPAGERAAATDDDDSSLLLPLSSDLAVRVAVIEGAAQIKTTSAEQSVTVQRGSQATWKMLEMSALTAFAVEPSPPVASLPAWTLADPADDAPEAAAVKSRLIDALAGVGDPGDLVAPLLKERNPQIGIQAARVLAVTRNVEHLIAALFEPLDETVHRVAIDGLSEIALSSPEGRGAIQTAIETRLPMAEVEPTMELILGLSETQKHDSSVARSLMDFLTNERLATRTLAIYRMEQATGDRLGFHPDAEASRRREAIRRWQKYLDRNNGQLLP